VINNDVFFQRFLRLVILSELEISQESTNSSTSSLHYMTISATWTPFSVDADTDHRVCFYARDSIGYSFYQTSLNNENNMQTRLNNLIMFLLVFTLE
jgi:hypothetical protein